MEKEYHWLLASSADPTKLAATIKGAIGLIATLAVFLGYKDLIDPIVQNADADTILSIATAVSGILSGVGVIFGVIRKIWNGYHK